MSEKTVNQEANNPTAGKPENTFTQAQLDAIVADRLKREREKYPDYDDLKAKAAELEALKEAGKSELEKAQSAAAEYKAQLEKLRQENTIRDARDKVSAETGIPAHLLSGQDEAECRKQAETLKQWRENKPKYPVTGDGGSPQGGGSAGRSTRDQFAEWFDTVLPQL